MSESRRDILEMLAKGQITTDEAERLLGLLENKAPTAGPRDSTGSARKLNLNTCEWWWSLTRAMTRAPRSTFACPCSCCVPASGWRVCFRFRRGVLSTTRCAATECPSIFRRSDRRTWKNWLTSSATSLLMSLKTGKR